MRGLSYPKVRAQAYRIVPRGELSRGQIAWLEASKDTMGEEEWTRWVKSRGKLHDWEGVHVRDSEGVMESLHIERLDGYTEAKGVPDWEFWHQNLGQHFKAELKGASGHLGPHQKREIPSMRRGGYTVFVWYPRDWATVERVFQRGLEQQ
jgi:hypothetical protein